jgi:hypothetical protein
MTTTKTKKNNEELFVSCPIPMATLISTLRNNQLQSLQSIVWDELNKRMEKDIADGKMLPLNDEEKQTANTNRIDAVVAYRKRTNCTLMIARRVVEMACKL